GVGAGCATGGGAGCAAGCDGLTTAPGVAARSGIAFGSGAAGGAGATGRAFAGETAFVGGTVAGGGAGGWSERGVGSLGGGVPVPIFSTVIACEPSLPPPSAALPILCKISGALVMSGVVRAGSPTCAAIATSGCFWKFPINLLSLP